MTWIGLIVGLCITFTPMMEEIISMYRLGGVEVVKNSENYANTLNAWRIMRLRDGLAFILPVFAMLPLGLSYCDDWVTGYSRFYVLRAQRRAYLLGKLTAALIASFCLVFLMSLISAGILSLIYTPFNSRYDEQIIQQVYSIPLSSDGLQRAPAKLYDWIYLGIWSGPVIFVLDSVLTGLSAAMCCAFGLAVSALLPNRYVAFAAPFVFTYLVTLVTGLFPGFLPWVLIFSSFEWYQPYRLSMLPVPAVLAIGAAFIAVWSLAFYQLAARRMEHAL